MSICFSASGPSLCFYDYFVYVFRMFFVCFFLCNKMPVTVLCNVHNKLHIVRIEIHRLL